MKKEIKQKTRKQRIKLFISTNKFFSNKKYFKTNKIATAAYDSWAARGEAGRGCRTCNSKGFNFTLHNKRCTTKRGNSRHWCFEDFGNFCSDCYEEIERQCGYNFKKY